ncbi:MAG: hypothetical protein NTW86_33075, partial [Candidatus Sumerlaeota bacterium]|nr:hypothetical protein [Candidatus Sumerlaeota bacterium]
ELPKLKQVEKYTFESNEELRRKMGLVLLGVGVTPKDLLDSYDVTWIEQESNDDVAAMRFVPRFEDNSGINAVSVWIDRKTLEPKQLLIEESEDTTRVTIQEFQLNPKDVSPKLFEAKFPKDWTVVDKLD